MNHLALQEALMNPEVELDRFLLNFRDQLQRNYEVNVAEIFQQVQEQQNVYAAEINRFVQAVLEVNVAEAPNRQIALLNESLLHIKNEQELIEKTLEEKEIYLKELERQKTELNTLYHKTASKVDSSRPKIFSEKEFYKAAHAAIDYAAHRKQGYTHASQSRRY